MECLKRLLMGFPFTSADTFRRSLRLFALPELRVYFKTRWLCSRG